jgi:hypothetical protein
MVMPWRVIGVVNLAGPTALESILPIQSQLCGAPVVTNLIEAHPLKCPRGKAGFAVKSFAIRVKQVLITGGEDKLVPAWWGQKYEEEAKKVGDDVSFIAVENASHFEASRRLCSRC